jgi:hypothetical protein
MGFSFKQATTMDVYWLGDVGKTPGVAARQSLVPAPNPTLAAAFSGPEFTRCFKFVQPGMATLP